MGVSPEVRTPLVLYGRSHIHDKEETMTTSQDAGVTTEEHAAPREAWDTIAAGYDRYVAPQEAALADEALRLVGLRAGERFLDVAAGTGGLSLPAARLGAEVLATDWSPAMIEQFQARVRHEGLSNAEGRVMDCHALDFPDDSFDVTGSQFGVMLVPDQPRALREMVRVTKPGGRVLVIAYGPPAELEFLQFFISALQAVAPDFAGLPDDPPPLEFQVSDQEVLRTAADRCWTEKGQGRKDGREAHVRLGTGDVGLGRVRQPNPGHAGRRSNGRAASETPPGPRRNAPRALHRERASCPDELRQHRHRDEVRSIRPPSFFTPPARPHTICRSPSLKGAVRPLGAVSGGTRSPREPPCRKVHLRWGMPAVLELLERRGAKRKGKNPGCAISNVLLGNRRPARSQAR